MSTPENMDGQSIDALLGQNGTGATSDAADEKFTSEQEGKQPRERDYRANPTNPPEEALPVKNLK